MQKKFQAIILFLPVFICLASCSKKHHPQTDTKTTEARVTEKENKPVPVRKVIKTPVPKVISVDDRGAKKAVDGRLYYDLEGHRYWKNYDDGKYYIFSSKMGGDPAFKPH